MIGLEFREWKQLWDTFTCVGRLICPEGRVSSLNKSNPTTSVQPVHRGQWSSFGGTSVKAVHALLCENSCLHWQSSTSSLHKCDQTTRDLYAPRPNGRGGMAWPPAPPVGLKVEEAMNCAEINAELVCPLRTPNFPPGMHDYDPKRHDLNEGVSKCMISRQEAQA